MQMFVAQLSNQIDQVEFEKAWRGDSGGSFAGVKFAFTGQTMSMELEPGPSGRWQTESVHHSVSDAVRRVDHKCNIRWK